LNRAEVIKLIRVLSANYRNWPADGKEEDTVLLWESMLADITFDVGQAAVKAHLSRSVYPPTIADIRDAAAMIESPHVMDAIEAWDLIGRAIRKYGYYRQEEAMASLPEDVAEMARRFTWSELCHSENVDTLRAQFRMAWDAQAKRIRDHGVMPRDIRELIESSGIIKRIGGGDGGQGRIAGPNPQG